MSDDRQLVQMLIADLGRPESLEALYEFITPGDLRNHIESIRESGTRFLAVLVGSGVAVVPLPTVKDLVAWQRVIVDLSINLGMVQPLPLDLDDATFRLLIDEIDAQVLSTGEVAGHA